MTPRQPDRDHISRPPGANSRPETGNMRFGCEPFISITHSDTSFSLFPWKKRPFCILGLFSRLVLSYSLEEDRKRKGSPDVEQRFKLTTNCGCRECGRSWGNQPRSICDECFSPLEITYDYDVIRASIAQGRFDQPQAGSYRCSGRRQTCGVMRNCCRFQRGLSRGCRSGSRLPVPGTASCGDGGRAAGTNDGKTAGENLYLKNDAVLPLACPR